jgi:hypothetical protein
MSPRYEALRDGNAVAIPEEHRPAGYEPPTFRIAPASAAGTTTPKRTRRPKK